MSTGEIRACYRLYAAHRKSHRPAVVGHLGHLRKMCLHRSPLSCSVAAPWRRAEANGLAAALDGVQIEESAIKQWHGLAWGAGAANPERAQRFEQADRVVVEAFADLHEARHLRSKFPAMSRGALQQFERKAWNRLIDYLIKLPPLPSDD